MEVTDFIGETGIYQNVMLVLSMYRGMMLAINNLCASFIFPEVEHWCARPPAYAHWDAQQWKAEAIPHGGSEVEDYSCMRYAISDNGGFDNLSVVSCNSWEYDHSEFWPSGTEMWNLVCGSAWKNALPQSIYMVGMTFGFVIMGPLSDIFGRRPVLLYGLVSYVILEYAMAAATSFTLFCLLRFLNAISVAAANNSLTLYVESIGPSYRGRSMVAYGIFWGVGIVVLAGLAAVVPGWKAQLAVFATMYALPLLLWRYIVESPKWLLTVGKYKEAEEAIRKITKINNVKHIDDEDLAKLKNQYKEQHGNRKATACAGILAMCNSRTMVIFTLTNVIFQFCTALVRYQLALDTGLLPVDPYMNFLVGGVIEAVSGIASHLILLYLPRKRSTICFLIFTMVAYLLHACLPKAYALAERLMMLVGRLCIGNVININIIYLSEMFPTGARALAIGFAQTVFGVGAAIQPHINHPFSNATWDAVFYAVVMLVAAVVLIPWPETKGRPLPDFVANVEASGSSETAGSVADGTNGAVHTAVHDNAGFSANEAEPSANEAGASINKIWNNLTKTADSPVVMELASFERVIGVRQAALVAGAAASPRGVGALRREHSF
ncbi:solute carrier family 22 member 6-B-like isoform X1 [Dermacentor variabilis]|uniref:solute carrier family 22 member 6-B-like isoform X1 n=1 Tax=Dermacentor variabilis TaxID=34621 RepID=UPI003F5CB480